MKIQPLTKSISHNIFVTLVTFGIGGIGKGIDTLLHLHPLSFPFMLSLGGVLFLLGLFLRLWASYYFYLYEMNVIVLHPQRKLLTSGPFRFSRNPLYLGGNVFMFYGISLCFQSLGGVLLTTVGIFLTHIMILREEKQLARRFGKDWTKYTQQVRRWI